MKNKEVKGFQSEVKQLLNLMIHSLYSNKEIFLRELISNASDAVDKLKFCALSNPKLYENEKKFYVRISYDKNNRTITIEDNGIGMTRKEVEENLGTIAKSGTKLFLSSIKSNLLKDNNQFIGQFGVGFYSSFIVAKKVVVRTRYAGLNKDQGVFWESFGEESYNIADITKKNRGTEISLFLRDGEDEFLDEWRIKNIIRKYSDSIDLPIEMQIEKKDEKDNNQYIIGSYSWEKINRAEALWIRNKKEISEIEYKEFYKYMFHDFDDPIIWSHNKVEGKQEYISLLYIPKKLPWEVWNREQKNNGIKFYSQRVYIMDSVEQFIPNYLRFTRGLVDSNDFPLNVSREILQENRFTKHLKRTLTKRILSMLETLSSQDSSKYFSFWEEFGSILKEGVGEDPNNKETISNLLRFSSTYEKEKYVSFSDYLNRMLKNQKTIYYIVADNYISAKNSPHLEFFQKEKIEVLLLYDQIDEWMMNHLKQFKNVPIQLISKSDSIINNSLEKSIEKQQDKEKIEILEHFLQRVRLHFKNRLKEIRFTKRLVDTPVILVTDKNDMSTQMVKLFSMSGGKNIPEIKYIFEINPKHKLIQYISNIKDQILFVEWMELLFDQALLIEKGALEDSNKFIKRINKLFSQSLNLEKEI